MAFLTVTSPLGSLLLRPPTESDAETVFAVHGDPAANLYNPAGPDRSLAASRRRLAGWLDDWARDGVGYHVLQGESGDVLGFVGVRHADASTWHEPTEPVLNLYYRLAPAAWGRGYAAAAAEAALDWAAVHRPGRPPVVLTRSDNSPSLALARRLGFLHWRDVIYGGGPGVEYRRPPALWPGDSRAAIG